MRIAFAVGVLMVIDVIAGPPQRPLLHGGGAEQRPDEARAARQLERAMRQVTVKDDGEAEGAKEV